MASASPRRRALLESLRIPFESKSPRADETPRRGANPAAAVLEIAERKVDAYLQAGGADANAFVIGVDTEVYIDGSLQGKPRDAATAEAMLRRLSGRSHYVYSGVVVRRPGNERHRHTEATRVTFRPLFDDAIRTYVATGEPLDKAGGYAIQGQGGALVSDIEGDPTNVVGLPLRALLRLLTQAGFPLPPHLRVS